MFTLTKKEAEGFAKTIDFGKQGGLVPAIAQDYRTKDILMLAYMDEEALVATLTTGKMHYYSRSRKRLWMKGEESAHFQNVIEVFPDCDNDTLLFIVEQEGVACHTGKKTCFTSPMDFLFHVIEDRKRNPKKGAYTNKLLKNKKLARAKIMEEALELVEAKKKKDVTWELVDVLYHSIAYSVGMGIDEEDVKKEILRRHEEKERKK